MFREIWPDPICVLLAPTAPSAVEVSPPTCKTYPHHPTIPPPPPAYGGQADALHPVSPPASHFSHSRTPSSSHSSCSPRFSSPQAPPRRRRCHWPSPGRRPALPAGWVILPPPPLPTMRRPATPPAAFVSLPPRGLLLGVAALRALPRLRGRAGPPTGVPPPLARTAAASAAAAAARAAAAAPPTGLASSAAGRGASRKSPRPRGRGPAATAAGAGANRGSPAADPPSVPPPAALPHLFIPPAVEATSRYVLLSDLHVRPATLPAALAALRSAYAAAVGRGAGIIFLGDWWHVRGALSVAALNAVVRELRTWTIPVVLVPGNHDQLTLGGREHALTALGAVLGDDLAVVVDAPALGMGALWVPFCRERSAFAAAVRAGVAAGAGALFCHVDVGSVVRADGPSPRVVGGPEGVEGGHAALQVPTPPPSIPRPSAVPAGLFPPDLCVYTGHIHAPGVTPAGVVCVGSPYEVSAGERGQAKRLLVVDRHAGWGVVETIPLDVGPRHFVVDLPAGGGVAGGPDAAAVSDGIVAAAAAIAPAAGDLPAVRAGDRVVLRVPGGDAAAAAAAVTATAALRAAGAGVRLLPATPPSGPAGSAAGTPVTTDAPAPRLVAAGAMAPAAVFRAFAAAKALPFAVVDLGLALLAEGAPDGDGAAGACGAAAATRCGCEVSVAFQSVRLRDYGCFRGTTTYPLDRRGVVAVVGDGPASNGVGKSTLVMAALWALTGRGDARPVGSVDRGVGGAMVNPAANSAEVTLRLHVSGAGVAAWAGAPSSEQGAEPTSAATNGAVGGRGGANPLTTKGPSSVELGALAADLDGIAAASGIGNGPSPADDVSRTPTVDDVAVTHADGEAGGGIALVVTRSARRITAASGRVRYIQRLRLTVDGVDASLQDTAATQKRLDTLLDTSLLPVVAFFGQQSRGALLDATDSEFKAALGPALELGVWAAAREMASQRGSKAAAAAASARAVAGASEELVARYEAAAAARQAEADAARADAEAIAAASEAEAVDLDGGAPGGAAARVADLGQQLVGARRELSAALTAATPTDGPAGAFQGTPADVAAATDARWAAAVASRERWGASATVAASLHASVAASAADVLPRVDARRAAVAALAAEVAEDDTAGATASTVGAAIAAAQVAGAAAVAARRRAAASVAAIRRAAPSQHPDVAAVAAAAAQAAGHLRQRVAVRDALRARLSAASGAAAAADYDRRAGGDGPAGGEPAVPFGVCPRCLQPVDAVTHAAGRAGLIADEQAAAADVDDAQRALADARATEDVQIHRFYARLEAEADAATAVANLAERNAAAATAAAAAARRRQERAVRLDEALAQLGAEEAASAAAARRALADIRAAAASAGVDVGLSGAPATGSGAAVGGTDGGASSVAAASAADLWEAASAASATLASLTSDAAATAAATVDEAATAAEAARGAAAAAAARATTAAAAVSALEADLATATATAGRVADLMAAASRARAAGEASPAVTRAAAAADLVAEHAALAAANNATAAGAAEEAATAGALEAAFGGRGVVSFLLDELLADLADRTNAYLRPLCAPGGGELALRLSATTAYRDAGRARAGQTREVIRKAVLVGGGAGDGEAGLEHLFASLEVEEGGGLEGGTAVAGMADSSSDDSDEGSGNGVVGAADDDSGSTDDDLVTADDDDGAADGSCGDLRDLEQLSGGQRRRVNLAASLAYADLLADRTGYAPDLLVLDEALAGLDDDGRARVAALLGGGGLAVPRRCVLVVAQTGAAEVAAVASAGVDVVRRVPGRGSVVDVGGGGGGSAAGGGAPPAGAGPNGEAVEKLVAGRGGGAGLAPFGDLWGGRAAADGGRPPAGGS